MRTNKHPIHRPAFGQIARLALTVAQSHHAFWLRLDTDTYRRQREHFASILPAPVIDRIPVVALTKARIEHHAAWLDYIARKRVLG